MNRVLASWWDSIQLLRPKEFKRLLLLTQVTVMRIRLWPIWLAGVLYGALLWYTYYKSELFTSSAFMMQLSTYGLVALEAFYIFNILAMVRSSVSQKDFYYWLKKLRWGLIFFPLYFVMPTYLLPLLILYMFFYLNTYGGIWGVIDAVYNSLVMILYNLPFVIVVGGLGAIAVYGIQLMRPDDFVLYLLLTPLLSSFIWVMYTKRLYDEMGLYNIR